MKATHVYSKGKYGWGIFYCLEDCLVFYTIFSVLVREMSLTVLAFCLTVTRRDGTNRARFPIG